jgi:conjugal transfer ATP-binding protein TraC
MVFDGPLAVNVDGALGVTWDLSRWNSETMEPDALGHHSARLASILRQLPDRSIAQLIVSIERGNFAGEYLKHGSGLLLDVARSKANALADARRMTVTMTFKTLPDYPCPPSALFACRPAKFRDQARSAYHEARQRFLDGARSVESALGAAGLAPRTISEDGLRRKVFRELNPGRTSIPARGEGPLRDHVLYSNVAFDPDTGSLRIGDGHVGLITVTELPTETRAGMLLPLFDLLPAADWILNIESPPASDIERFLKSKKRLAFCQERGRDYQADIASIKGEIDSLLTQMVMNGTRILGSRIHVRISGRDESDVDEQCRRMLNALHSLGFGAVRETTLALTLFLQCLPLAYDPANDRALKRSRKMQDINLAHLAPVYRNYSGTARPDLLLVNRSGEPAFFSFFEGDLAPHGIICGISGSGKSVLSNNIILEGLRRGARVFVLDRGGSYRKLAELLGGQVVCLSPDRPLCVNPLGGELTQERAIFATDYLSEMLTAGRWDLPTRERSELAQAVRLAHRGGRVNLRDIRAHLKGDLGVSMELFTQGGPYGPYFDGDCGIDCGPPLVVFELEEAALNKEISSTLLMAIIHRITEECVRNPQVEKYLIVDEAWTLLKSPATARFLENVFRTFRKHRTCALMVSQQVTDFEGTSGEAIRANAPHRIFLRQISETLKVMERVLDLKPREKEVLSTLTTVKGQFSEMLILSPRGSGVARLIQDPLTYWLTTTDPADRAILDELLKKHPLRQALQLASMRHPKGAPHE